MNIKNISEYSDSQLDLAKSKSPAVTRYLSLITKTPSTDFEKIIILRHTHWLECALAQIHQTSSAQDICKYWSLKTNIIIKKVWDLFPHRDELALFALGKLGAFELNLSSDIDILLVSLKPATKEQLKFYRQFNDFLSAHTELGFCYRLDFNLRPGGRLGPTICSTQQFEDYYWTQGATWERIALNRLAPICGNEEVIEKVAKIRDKFCYRKFIDYSLINDIQNIRSHIHAENSNSEKINLKLCAGGIRDIELYVNSLQVIHGGKLPQIRTTETSTAIHKLKDNNIIPDDEAAFLEKTYWQYRVIENLIQIENDQQTHELKVESELYLNHKQNLVFDKVNILVAKLIGEKPKLSPLLPDKLEKQMEWLTQLGFSPKVVHSIWPNLIKLTLLAKNSQIDEIYRSRFLYNFITHVKEYGLDKELSLHLVYDFIRSIRPKRSFYHLLEQEPNIVKELSVILSSSPYLGNLISSKPELLDSFLLKKTQSFSNELGTLISQLSDYKQLNQLLVSSQFLTNKNTSNLTDTCSTTADKICIQLLTNLKNKFTNNTIDIIKLGKWGGAELGLLSDLDFIFVTENEITDDDIKISRRFINFLTNRQQGGEIYKIDMRLRPQSGTGTVITTKEQLLKYITKDAKTWEAQAYLKASPLIDESFRADILKALNSKVFNKNFSEELLSIKNKVIQENFTDTKNSEGGIDFKYSPGGLIDIEFTLQIYFLNLKIKPEQTSTIGLLKQAGVSSKLISNYVKLRFYEQTSQILSQNHTTVIYFSDQNFVRLANYQKMSLADAKSEIKNLLTQNQQLLQECCII